MNRLAISLKPKETCTGCGVCAFACSQNCIELKADVTEGFLYPHIDEERCVCCGKCMRACPLNMPDKWVNPETTTCFAGWHNDDAIRLESSSGGLFSALAEFAFDREGAVFGVVSDQLTGESRHICALDPQAIHSMRKSKYTQSRCDQVFGEVRAFLAKEKTVLFTGTPCQVVALYSALEDMPLDNLYTVDILCHGVTSNKLLTEYRHSIERKCHSKVREITFREKVPGRMWDFSCVMTMNMEDGEIIRSNAPSDSFWKAYLENLSLRPSCYHCPFTGTRRAGDVTIADFWGIGHREPFEYDTQKGVSLLLINNDKGEQMVRTMARQLTIIPQSLEDAKAFNKALIKPVDCPKMREFMFRQLGEKPFDRIIRRLFPFYYFKQTVKHVVGEANIQTIKRLMRMQGKKYER